MSTDGRPIRSQDVNYLGGSNLQLLRVSPDDEATYVCSVENTVTGVSVQAQAQLLVVGESVDEEGPLTTETASIGERQFQVPMEGQFS